MTWHCFGFWPEASVGAGSRLLLVSSIFTIVFFTYVVWYVFSPHYILWRKNQVCDCLKFSFNRKHLTIWWARIGMNWRVQQNMAQRTALVAGQTIGRIPSSWHGSIWLLQLFLLVVCVAQHLQQLSKSPRSAMWALSAFWLAASSVARHEGIAKSKHASHLSFSTRLQTRSTCMSKISLEKHWTAQLDEMAWTSYVWHKFNDFKCICIYK